VLHALVVTNFPSILAFYRSSVLSYGHTDETIQVLWHPVGTYKWGARNVASYRDSYITIKKNILPS